MNPHRSQVGIVGGGILGLTAALRMADAGADVTVYERAPAVGGLASSARFGDVTWDRFYHVILQTDHALLDLLHRLDLDDEVVWRPTGTGLYAKGRLYPVTTARDYAVLPVLGMVSKARIAGTMLRASSIHTSDRLETISARTWLSRWSGPTAYDRFWQPLLRSKLGDRHDEASAAFIWAIMRRLYEARRAGMKQDLFGYVPGGYARILTRLGEALEEAGVEVKVASEVREVIGSTTASGCFVRTSDGDHEHERVVVTAPSPIAVKLIPELNTAEREAHLAIPYQGVVCVSLLLDRPLGGFYVTNITDSGFPFTGVIEMSALVDRSEFGGRSLVYLPSYVHPDDPLFEADDQSIVEHFTRALGGMYGAMVEQSVLASTVSRARHVLPVSTVGYSTRLPSMQTSVRGVSIVNTAHILHGTLNANETIDLANRVSPDILDGVPAGRHP